MQSGQSGLPMGSAILIRVKPTDYDRWLKVHVAASEARREYGITDGPVYRDAVNSNIALVHLNVEDVDRAMKWFQSDRFKEGVKRAGIVEREFWIAQKR